VRVGGWGGAWADGAEAGGYGGVRVEAQRAEEIRGDCAVALVTLAAAAYAQNIVQLAESDPELSLLVAALKAGNLVTTRT
jgi:hypothetical protein